jgi:DNA-binding protein HU-beta
MNKAEIVAALQENMSCLGLEVTKAQAEGFLNSFRDLVIDQSTKGNDVQLPGLGKFFVKSNSARTGRNPQTGEAIEIAASRGLGFKQAAQVKSALN